MPTSSALARSFERICSDRSAVMDSSQVTLTAVYAPHQVLVAVGAGVEYAAPYLGRMTEMGRGGRDSVAKMQGMINGVDSPMRLLVASLRNVDDLCELMVR